MRSGFFGGLLAVCALSVGAVVGIACAVPNIDEELPTDDPAPLDPIPDSSFSSSGSSGSTSGGSTDAAPADAAVDTGVDAGPVLDGTYTGAYTNNRPFAGCNFMNAGDLTATFSTAGATLTTTANVTGLEIRDEGCFLAGKVTGSAPASTVTDTAGTFTGTWKMDVSAVGGTLDMPFTAKVSGKTITGSWTCTGCTGSFTISKP